MKKFCHACGVEIDVQERSCPHCGAVQPSEVGYRKIIATVLAITLGSFGIHKFYLGRPGWGVVYLLLSWSFLPGLLGVIEGILYIAMTPEEFRYRYGK